MDHQENRGSRDVSQGELHRLILPPDPLSGGDTDGSGASFSAGPVICATEENLPGLSVSLYHQIPVAAAVAFHNLCFSSGRIIGKKAADLRFVGAYVKRHTVCPVK